MPLISKAIDSTAMRFCVASDKIETPKASRIAFIDVAKGFGITPVVLGHSWLVTLEHTKWLKETIYAFHMPLFFFLSGMFFRPNTPYIDFTRSKSAQLLKPYLVVLLSLGVLKILLKDAPFIPGLIGIFYGSGKTIPFVSLWFLGHLWIVFQFAWIVENLTALSKRRLALQIAIMFAILWTGCFMLRVFEGVDLVIPQLGVSFANVGLPLSADLTSLTAFFFLLGYLLKKKVVGSLFGNRLFVPAVGMFFAVAYFGSSHLNLNQRSFEPAIEATFLASLGIYVSIGIARVFTTVEPARRIFSYLGANSLIVLLFHGPIQSVVFEQTETQVGGITGGLLAFFASILGSLIIGSLLRRNVFLARLVFPAPKAAS